MVGLGLMGAALTELLLGHGYRVAVWNPTQTKAAQRMVEPRSTSECGTCREPAGN
jgi:3-hydroxyisobutyrate dehydrogenase-like beta-hydroxyacid dehydrogenase